MGCCLVALQTVQKDHSKWVVTGRGRAPEDGGPQAVPGDGPSASTTLSRRRALRATVSSAGGAGNATSYGVGVDASRQVEKTVCFGNINRSMGQFKRGGGTLCFRGNAALWAQFDQIVSEVAPCGEL